MTRKPSHAERRATQVATESTASGHRLNLVKAVAFAAGRRSKKTTRGLFSAEELTRLEREHAEGLTAVQIVEMFSSRGVRFSEATFRKYVQLGLVPRSKRVGRKGKHRGSLGVYPAKAVRRINDVRRLMGDGKTIEEIQGELLRFADAIETLEEGVVDLFQRLDNELEGAQFDTKVKTSLRHEIDEARRSADDLLERLDDLSRRVGKSEQPFGDRGAAGSAEELL